MGLIGLDGMIVVETGEGYWSAHLAKLPKLKIFIILSKLNTNTMPYLPPLKRALDIIVALFLSLVFLPVWIIVPLLIALLLLAQLSTGTSVWVGEVATFDVQIPLDGH